MLKLKPGTRILGIKPETVLAIAVAQSVFDSKGYDCTITSGVDGRHSRGSRHYSGYAFDLRTRHLPDTDAKQRIHLLLKQALGADFDVILEPTHIHVEYDPKTPL